jgi:hypothetical protein
MNSNRPELHRPLGSLPSAFQMSELACVTAIQETMQHTAWESTLIEGMQFSSKTAAYILVPKK